MFMSFYLNKQLQQIRLDNSEWLPLRSNDSSSTNSCSVRLFLLVLHRSSCIFSMASTFRKSKNKSINSTKHSLSIVRFRFVVQAQCKTISRIISNLLKRVLRDNFWATAEHLQTGDKDKRPNCLISKMACGRLVP